MITPGSKEFRSKKSAIEFAQERVKEGWETFWHRMRRRKASRLVYRVNWEYPSN